ncbi:MAG TPA: hypothetical protein VJA94_22790 [Candidatus Angelobacter sp.]
MRSIGSLTTVFFIILLLGCSKSSKLAALLPDTVNGWEAEGGALKSDVPGVGHSAARSYVDPGFSSESGIERIKVQILVAEKGADQKRLEEMSIDTEGVFKEKREIGYGFPAYQSLSQANGTHSLEILPKSGTFVSIVAYGGWASMGSENERGAFASFVEKIDLKKIAAIE